MEERGTWACRFEPPKEEVDKTVRRTLEGLNTLAASLEKQVERLPHGKEEIMCEKFEILLCIGNLKGHIAKYEGWWNHGRAQEAKAG